MKKAKILYWIFVGLFGGLMVFSAVPDILVDQMAVDGFHQIGLPKALVPFVGWAKLIGVITILLPGHPRLKEWAYAGLFIDLIGATYLIIAAGMPLKNWIFMSLPLALGAAAYMAYRNYQAMEHSPGKTVRPVAVAR